MTTRSSSSSAFSWPVSWPIQTWAQHSLGTQALIWVHHPESRLEQGGHEILPVNSRPARPGRS